MEGRERETSLLFTLQLLAEFIFEGRFRHCIWNGAPRKCVLRGYKNNEVRITILSRERQCRQTVSSHSTPSWTGEGGEVEAETPLKDVEDVIGALRMRGLMERIKQLEEYKKELATTGTSIFVCAELPALMNPFEKGARPGDEGEHWVGEPRSRSSTRCS